MHHNVTEGKFEFLTKISKSLEFYCVESGLYLSLTDNVDALNNVIQERHNHSENCNTVNVSRRTQKIEIYLENEDCAIAFFSMDLGDDFGSNSGNEHGAILRRKRPNKLEFGYNIV